MLILPIVNKNRILNVEVSLRDASKVREGVSLEEVEESDVIVNGRSFLKSSFNSNSSDSRAVVDFIRNNLVPQSKKFSVTTKRGDDMKTCDVYDVFLAPDRVSDVFDALYSKVILSMQKETPGVLKSKYLSFESVGLGDVFSDSNVSKVKKIVSNVYDRRYWMGMFQDEGLVPMFQILSLMDMFECSIVSEASISEEELLDVIESFEKINSKDTKSLKKYYNMALDNRDIYGKMSYVSKLVYDRPMDLITSSKKKERSSMQLVKTDEKELSQVA